jgi:hypothetical protein
MKRILALILILAMVLPLCGCKENTTSITICVHYGGYSISGEDLGSGSYNLLFKGLKEGDRIYEIEPGKLTERCRNEEMLERWILKIDSIDGEYVKFTARQTFKTSYDEMAIPSYYQIDDGTNYYYTVISVDGGREPYMQNW